jgi:hypothetical protein
MTESGPLLPRVTVLDFVAGVKDHDDCVRFLEFEREATSSGEPPHFRLVQQAEHWATFVGAVSSDGKSYCLTVVVSKNPLLIDGSRAAWSHRRAYWASFPREGTWTHFKV